MHPDWRLACSVGVKALQSAAKSSPIALFFLVGFESTQLARQVQQKQAQVEAQN